MRRVLLPRLQEFHLNLLLRRLLDDPRSRLTGVLCSVIASYVRRECSHKFAEIANNRKRSFSLFSCPISTAHRTRELVRAGKAKLQGWFLFWHVHSLTRRA
jgi:hypothetical protein